MQPSYSTILFDFDGTLTPTLELWLQAYHYAFEKFDLSHPDEIVIKRCFYRDFDLVAKEFNLPCAIRFEEMVWQGLDIFIKQARLFSGVQEILEKCANSNVNLAVVTSSTRAIVEKSLNDLGVRAFFDTVVTSDDIVNYKPHPEPVLLALKRLGGKAESCAIIGDSQADILAGQAAGITTGLFYPQQHSQFYEFQSLLETKPHFIFHDYDELEQHLFDMSSIA